MSENCYFQTRERDGVLVLCLSNVSLDRAAANEFGKELLEVLDRQRPNRLIINLSDVPKLSSPALGQLMLLDKRVTASGGRMLICDPTVTVRQLISLAWAGRASDESMSEDAAIAELTAWQPA